MTTNHKIYIVEDVSLTRLNLEMTLSDMGYKVVGSSATAEKAWADFATVKADLLLCDINLAGERNGTWLADQVTKTYNIPVVYLTAFGDEATIDNALSTKPAGYLMKPFDDTTLKTTIQIALNNANENSKLQVKDGYNIVHIDSKSILYLQSEANYVNIHTGHSKTHVVREKLDDIVKRLPNDLFMQVHNRYVVNTSKVDELRKDNVIIQHYEIPISKKFKKVASDKLGLS